VQDDQHGGSSGELQMFGLALCYGDDGEPSSSSDHGPPVSGAIMELDLWVRRLLVALGGT
jgi:hypothetical protein